MHCILCGGATRVELVTTAVAHRGEQFRLDDVPAEVCTVCHEPYFELAIYDEMADEAARLWAVRHATGL